MPIIQALHHGTPYFIDLGSHGDGWHWSCVVDGLLINQGTYALETEPLALDAAHQAAIALIAEFYAN